MTVNWAATATNLASPPLGTPGKGHELLDPCDPQLPEPGGRHSPSDLDVNETENSSPSGRRRRGATESTTIGGTDVLHEREL
jgi:hypothetical protein